MKKDLSNETVVHIEKCGLEIIQFRKFVMDFSNIQHCFTTRHGGVSSGNCSTLNLGFKKEKKRENVIENFKKLAETLELDIRNLVFSDQIHEDLIYSVSQKDKGKGIIAESDIIGVDGLITDQSGIVLVTFYADCVPVFFYDPVKKVIALSHSGWRGTVKNIAGSTVRKMVNDYGCVSEDIYVGIGPSIGSCCFEVGEEVFSAFKQQWLWSEQYCTAGKPGKWYIDLPRIIRKNLIEAAVTADNIYLSGICTQCNKDVFFSHRGDEGKTGTLAAMITMR